jgi:hypothetical protein
MEGVIKNESPLFLWVRPQWCVIVAKNPARVTLSNGSEVFFCDTRSFFPARNPLMARLRFI